MPATYCNFVATNLHVMYIHYTILIGELNSPATLMRPSICFYHTHYACTQPAPPGSQWCDYGELSGQYMKSQEGEEHAADKPLASSTEWCVCVLT